MPSNLIGVCHANQILLAVIGLIALITSAFGFETGAWTASGIWGIPFPVIAILLALHFRKAQVQIKWKRSSSLPCLLETWLEK
jgi:hypothetical protein